MIFPGKQKLVHVGSSIQQIVSFGTVEGLARALNWSTMALLPLLLGSSEEYGRVGLLVAIEMLASNISLMGMNRAVLRFYAKDESPGTLLRSILTIWAGLAWLPLAVVLLLRFAGRETVFGIPLAPHLLVLSLAVAIFNLNLLCISIGRAQRNLAIFLRFRLCYVALRFVLVLLIARLLGHSLSYVFGVGVSVLAMLIFIVPFLCSRADARSDRAVVGRLLIFGWPFVFHVISGNILSYFSRFFLQAYSTTKDVGVFTFAFTLGSSLYIVYATLNTYFEPRIYSHADDKPRSERWLGYYTKICVAFAAAGGAILLLVYPYFLSYLPADYARARPIIAVIMATVLLQPLYLEGNYRLTVHQKTHHIASSSLLAAGLNVALNFLLIPPYGIRGAAIVLYVSSFFRSAYILVISMHAGSIPWRQHRGLPVYGVCVVGSLSVVLANRTGFAIPTLMMVCLTVSGLLVRSFVAHGERSR
ncbi:MAG: lipopolysaccharide biosynthesis protein [Planctomycetota bacterium]